MVYYSELIGKPVIDVEGKKISVVKDFCFFDKARYANISCVVCIVNVDGEKKEKIIPWKFVEAVGDKPTDYFPLGIYLNKRLDEIKNIKADEDKQSFLNNIIDKQLIDINGARIIRVNDILLGIVGKKFSLIGVDVSAKGLLRRLGMLKFFHYFNRKIQEHIILWKDVAPVSKDVANIRLKVKQERLNELHPAELADMIRDLNIEEKLMVFNSLDKKKAAETLLGAQPDIQKTFFKSISLKKIASLLETLPSNEAASILEMMPAVHNKNILRIMKPGIAAKVRKVLSYEQETAGSLMSTRFFTINQDFSVKRAINFVKHEMPNPRHIFYIYVKGNTGELKGVVSLRDLILANPNKKISDILRKDIIHINVNTYADDIFNLMSKYGLLAIPVVDKQKNIVGVIRVNDVLKVMIPSNIKKQRIIKHKKIVNVSNLNKNGF